MERHQCSIVSDWTSISAEQIKLELNNRGYLNAVVDTLLSLQENKINVTYDVDGNDPYRILTYKDDIKDTLRF